nr:hypothetical protein [uncultured Devosia sp.]
MSERLDRSDQVFQFAFQFRQFAQPFLFRFPLVSFSDFAMSLHEGEQFVDRVD